MLRKMIPAIVFLAILISSVVTLTEAFVYQTNSQTMTQTIRNSLEETLRPNASSVTNLGIYPSGTPNWECVNDIAPDEDSTYVFGRRNGYGTDLYEVQDHVSSGNTIRSVTIWVRCRSTIGTQRGRIVVNTYDNNYFGAFDMATSYSNHSTTYAANPYSGVAWTWAEIDSLRVGVSLRSQASRCTQVWIVVTYV